MYNLGVNLKEDIDMKLVTLKDCDYTATINLSRGANCISLRNERYNAKILREPDYSKGELDNPYLYGMPILFPVNRISGGQFEFEGRTYRFPINEEKTGCHLHGMIHKEEFKVLEEAENRVLCVYKADKSHPYLEFPHEFEIRMEYILDEKGLTHKVEVVNHSKENMPLMIGFHTTFNIAFAGDGEVVAKAVISEEYERNMAVNYLPTGNKPTFDSVSKALNAGEFSVRSQPVSRHYRASDKGSLELYNKDKRLKMVYENDEKYAFRLIYNGKADEYICLEPQTCLANAPNSQFSRDEAGFKYIESGASMSFISRIYLQCTKEN